MIQKSVVPSYRTGRSRNHTELLRAALPVLILLGVVVGYRIVDRVSSYIINPKLGAMTRNKAVELAERICKEMTSANPAVLNVTAYEAVPDRGTRTHWNEWDVVCATGDFKYTFRINADSGEVVMIHRDGIVSSVDSDIRLDREALRITRQNHLQRVEQGRHYLSLTGFTVSDKDMTRTRNSYDFMYEIPIQHFGTAQAEGKRMLRVRLDPVDGSLVDFQNVVSRKYPTSLISMARTDEARS